MNLILPSMFLSPGSWRDREGKTRAGGGGKVRVGADDEVAHGRAEDRGPPIRLADHGSHRHHDLLVLDHAELEGGHVDEKMAAAEIARQPAPALEVEGDLRGALRRRNVEGGQGAG